MSVADRRPDKGRIHERESGARKQTGAEVQVYG